jgi:NAD(P)H-nitrite reductase large subunit
MNNSPIICYCKNVTEAEIIEHVANKRCCSTIEDIQHHTGANTGAECHRKNPSGTCCYPVVQSVIARALKMRK